MIDSDSKPPSERLQHALTAEFWSPWASFTDEKGAGTAPPDITLITRQEWEWMWEAVIGKRSVYAPTTQAKMFPIQALLWSRHPVIIPWEHAEAAYKEYCATFSNCQSLERIAERGGFGAGEIIALLVKRIERLEKGKQ